MRYLLIEHTDDDGRTARVTEHDTTFEREIATLETMEGNEWSHVHATEEDFAQLEPLRQDGWLRFEGEPPLQWVDAI